MSLSRIKRNARLRVRRAKKTITFDQLTESAGSQAFAFGAIPADAIVLGYVVNVKTGFTDGVAGDFDIDLGDGTTADNILDGGDLNVVAKLDPAAALHTLLEGGTFTATVLATVDVDTATAGEADITVFYIEV